jgi:hypothetical protein
MMVLVSVFPIKLHHKIIPDDGRKLESSVPVVVAINKYYNVILLLTLNKLNHSSTITNC